QAAAPTTVGKRACLWLQNFVMDLSRLEFEQSELRFHGVKGATGTQDTYVKLFDGDKRKVEELDRRVGKKMGFSSSYLVTGQTYPRKVDTRIITLLAGIGESASKMGNDLRILQALHEVEEPREDSQVGSSAMPYKQNPMRSERMVALSRFVINLVGNCFETASNQWFERTLDDSANRRLVIPQAFLVTDGVLNLAINIASGLKVRESVIAQHLDQEIPFLQTEEILMAAVRAGGDRQVLHERIRKHAEEVIHQIREKGGNNDLLARIRKDAAFSGVLPKLMIRSKPEQLVGMAPEQVGRFIRTVVEPIRRKYGRSKRIQGTVRV
ncbi:MAG TPA: lyase family protein, partial [Bdellovibrionota bacterium]|nr:lyase family protein [Bdellovibrionota bacterium]